MKIFGSILKKNQLRKCIRLEIKKKINLIYDFPDKYIDLTKINY